VADDYYPFDATSGYPVTAAIVAKRLGQRLQAVEANMAAARLGERCVVSAVADRNNSG
jgi:hypothetical protein